MTDSQWITKEEAGIRLGSPERPLSGRRVHDLAKDGRLQSTQVRDPDTGHMAIRIHAGSVERFIFERDNPDAQIAQITRSNTSERSRGSRGTQELMDHFIMRMVRAAQSAPSARLWLTIPESAAYSGLPAPVLVDFIAQGKLAAMDVGRRRGGRWRIRRRDLEGFSG